MYFCKQKAYKVTNFDMRLSIRKEVNGNDLIHYMENSCPFTIAHESEIGTIISSQEIIWKDIRHVKVHLIKSKINPNNILPDIDCLSTIVTCHGNIGLPISDFARCSIDFKTLLSFLHTS